MMSEGHHGVGDILDALCKLADEHERVSIGDMLEAFGQRGYGAALLVPALIEISPVGGIPGLPTFLAAILILFAIQIVMGKDHLWLPGFIERRSLKAETVRKASDKLRGIGRFLDRWFHGRMRWITKGIWVRVAAGCVILLALTVPPLELLPFASTMPMAAIAAFGLALLVHDGVLMLVAFVAAAAAIVGSAVVGLSASR